MDYLAIGHVTEDLWPDGKTPGGPVMYASRTALAWLDHVGVLTAAGDNFDSATAFPGVDVRLIPAPSTTQFRNIYMNGGRRQIVWPCPVRITAGHLTDEMLGSRIIHLAPVCNEVDAGIVSRIPAGAFVGVTPQGWLRRWDEQGAVYAAGWEDAGVILPRASATVFSIDDVAGDWDIVRDWASQTSILVVTQAAEGCTLFLNGAPIHVPAPQVAQVEPTGAGDIFAASLFIALQQGCEPVRACAIANCIAANSVTFPRGQGFPTRQDAERCEQAVV
ncbi:MAG: PfkB family carbohydrate kinase [Candidatus Roseilinea sp.]|uniref:PfkB family carbohydrate kinase n=1 Tax=Candidatus Roseilinea sp. TaxID=2838777 RepID=UPI00404AA542